MSMNAVDQITGLLREKWGTKTLAAFRDEAAKEFNGTLFESVREQNGIRIMLVICLTGQHEIETLKIAFRLDESGKPADWGSTTVTDVVICTMQGSGLSYQAEYDTKGRPTAVLLISTEPRSMKILERLFRLPP
jgi:hypothetical protein